MSSQNVHITDAVSDTTKAAVTGSGALKTDSSAVTQPVSGTVTANVGTAGTLALDATLTGGTQKTKLVDTGGTNVAAVSAANALKVDGSAVTQPVSGTVTANAGTGTFNTAAALPSTANILGNSATTNGSTIITIPVNRIWQGWITLSATITSAGTVVTTTPTVTIVSAGTSFPLTTTILLATQASVIGSATLSVAAGNANSIFVTVGSPTSVNSATLQLNNGANTAPQSMIATAEGVLL